VLIGNYIELYQPIVSQMCDQVGRLNCRFHLSASPAIDEAAKGTEAAQAISVLVRRTLRIADNLTRIVAELAKVMQRASSTMSTPSNASPVTFESSISLSGAATGGAGSSGGTASQRIVTSTTIIAGPSTQQDPCWQPELKTAAIDLSAVRAAQQLEARERQLAQQRRQQRQIQGQVEQSRQVEQARPKPVEQAKPKPVEQAKPKPVEQAKQVEQTRPKVEQTRPKVERKQVDERRRREEERKAKMNERLKLTRQELVRLAKERAADDDAVSPPLSPEQRPASPTSDGDEELGKRVVNDERRGDAWQLNTVKMQAVKSPRMNIRELTSSELFASPIFGRCESFQCETGDLERDELAEDYLQNSSSLFFVDEQRYTPYYSRVFDKVEHRVFVGVDVSANPLLVLVEELAPEVVECAREMGERTPYSRALVITCRPWTPDVDAEFWLLCRLTGLSVKEQAVKLHKVLDAQLPGFVSAKRLVPVTVPRADVSREFMRLERVLVTAGQKFGVLQCLAQQTTEAQMYSNSVPAMRADFKEFLRMLGTPVHMRGYTGFRGGLDTQSDATGKISIATQYKDIDIMFHVGPLLPATAQAQGDEDQFWGRKRHIGNDVVVFIFVAADHQGSIDIDSFRSNMNHVFIAVQPHHERALDGTLQYRIACASKDGVHSFLPRMPSPAILPAGPVLRNFLLTKAINSERTAMYAPGFIHKLKKARRAQLASSVEVLAPAALLKKIERSKSKGIKAASSSSSAASSSAASSSSSPSSSSSLSSGGANSSPMLSGPSSPKAADDSRRLTPQVSFRTIGSPVHKQSTLFQSNTSADGSLDPIAAAAANAQHHFVASSNRSHPLTLQKSASASSSSSASSLSSVSPPLSPSAKKSSSRLSPWPRRNKGSGHKRSHSYAPASPT
jgi:Rap/ran-GAP